MMSGRSRQNGTESDVSLETYPHAPTTPSGAKERPAWPDVAPGVRRNMQSNKGTDTAPELAVRSILHQRGMRFRVNTPLPFSKRRRADITFTRVNLYIFIDGCFWHGCPEHYVAPRTRPRYWSEKIASNQARDLDTTARLTSSGSTVLRYWEHTDPELIADDIHRTYLHLN